MLDALLSSSAFKLVNVDALESSQYNSSNADAGVALMLKVFSTVVVECFYTQKKLMVSDKLLKGALQNKYKLFYSALQPSLTRYKPR